MPGRATRSRRRNNQVRAAHGDGAGVLPASATAIAATDRPVADGERAITALTGPALGLVRIAIGYLWFTQTQWKMPPTFGCNPGQVVAEGNNGLCDWVGREIANPKFGFYRQFLTDFVVPNFGVVGWLVYGAELLTAILLILGLLTRFAGILGAAQGLNLMIGLWAVPHEWYWTYAMLALINLTLALTAAGRWLGVDALLHPRAVAAAARGNALARLVARLT